MRKVGFIVLPEVIASVGFGWVMVHLLNDNRLAAVVAGGVFFLLASVLTLGVEDKGDPRTAKPASISA